MRKLIALLVALSMPAAAAYPTLRGTPVITTTATSIAWPTGTAVGDLVIAICANENNVFNPGGGWANNVNFGGTAQISGCVFSKVMNSADIAAGSFSFSPNGSFPGVYALVAIVGSSQNGVRETPSSQFGSGATSRTLTTSGAVTNTDLGIYFGAVRVNTTPTISPGTLVGTQSGSVSGALYTQNIPSSGALTITYSYPSAGAGDVQFIVVIKSNSASAGVSGFSITY